ncbi:MAG: polysaccharide pyruvyl transferase CsaB [Clostridia bacterium]|nr:polysaccharide pyruvyl transferase CsaB [Clostridia bacterium]
MNIMHIAGGGDIGGAKTHVISLLAALKERHNVVLVSLRQGPFSEDAIAAGIPTAVIHSSNYLHIVKSIRAIIAEKNIDVIHCHGGKANLAGLILRSVTHIPVVTTVHSDYRYDYMGSLVKRCTNGLINTYAIHRLDYRIAVTEVFAELLIDRGFDPSRIFTINNSLEFADADPMADRADLATRTEYLNRFGLTCDENTVVVSIAARFHPVKDVSTLIRAFAVAANENPDLRLLIGGCGVAELEKQEEARLRALLSELKLEDRAAFTGWINDMDTFLSITDISVLCSLSEGFPYSLLESVRRGAALCCSRVGAIPGIIDHGVNGLLIDPRDSDALARNILTLAGDRSLRLSFARSLYNKCRLQYSLDTMTAAQEEIYRTILRRESAPHRRRYGVTVCGAYGFDNSGDDAILASIVRDMRIIDPDMPITVISKKPDQTRRTTRCRSIYTFNLFKILHALRRSSLYINGGGTLMQDKTSTKSLLYYLATLRLARMLGTPVMLYGSGIGPINRPKNRRIAGRILNSCADVITLRDEASYNELKSLSVTRPFIALTGDPAIGTEPPADTRIRSLQLEHNIDPDVPYACVALRSWEGTDEDMRKNCAIFCDRLSSDLGMQVVFLPMAYPRDLDFMDSVAAQMETKPLSVRRQLSVRDTVGLISKSSLVFAMRLHALVFAVSQNVPAVGFSYDIKVTSFLEYAESPFSADLAENDPDRLLELCHAAIAASGGTNAAAIRSRADKNRAYASLLLAGGRKTDPQEFAKL